MKTDMLSEKIAAKRNRMKNTELKPVADAKNIIFFKDYRLTVLDGGLLRIEKHTLKEFNDRATLAVWFRDMPPQRFGYAVKKDRVVITTEKAEFVVCEDFKKSYVLLNGKRVKLSEAKSMGGTYRTLDSCDGDYNTVDEKKISLNKSVVSTDGVAVLDDGKTNYLENLNEVAENFDSRTDLYVFAYGHEYREAVRAYFKITGFPPMLPREAFGNWWSRYYPYTDKKYLSLLDEFADRDIPFTVATVDTDWHYVDVSKEFSVTDKSLLGDCFMDIEGWTGYTWNERLFPDYKSFLKEVKQKGYKIILNLHPSDGVRFFEKCYSEFAKRVGFDASSKKLFPLTLPTKSSEPHILT